MPKKAFQVPFELPAPSPSTSMVKNLLGRPKRVMKIFILSFPPGVGISFPLASRHPSGSYDRIELKPCLILESKAMATPF
jgi:hypothetical protein